MSSGFRLQADQIQENYKKFYDVIDTFGERSANLKVLYDSFGERLMFEPASSFEHFHNAIPGGYVDHVLRVVEFSEAILETWTTLGLDCSNFTKDELRFAAFNHDLGKLGFSGEQGGQYVVNKSEWHRKNMGKMYESNPAIPFLLVPDRSLFLLQLAAVPVSLNEYLGIRIHDGLYDESNKGYLLASKPESRLRTNLPLILHQADMLASRKEYERWAASTGKEFTHMDFSLTGDLSDQYVAPVTTPKAKKESADPSAKFDTMFDDLFK